jgi:Rieske Fe-S protein
MDEKLRDDFPVNWEDDHFVTRREFFKFMTLASGGLALGTAAMAAYTKLPKHERAFEPARIASIADLSPGEAMPFNYPRPRDLCLLVRRKDGEYVAYSRRCTHLSCPVVYEAGTKERLFCPCHNGAFSVEDGGVLQGPPPHALPRIVIDIRGEEIYAVGVRHES